MARSLFTIVFIFYYLAINAQEVAQWRGPNRNGIYNETGLLKAWPDGGPKMLWHFDELGQGHTSAAVTNSGIYITGMIEGKGNIFALGHDGKLKWKKEYGPEWTESHFGVRSTPLVINDKLYFMSSFGQLFCLSTSNGEVIWSVDTFREFGGRNITWGVTENLAYDGNILYCAPGGSEVSVIALDRNTGKLIWKGNGKGEKSAYCSPLLVSLAKRKILVTMMETSIQGYDTSSGQLLWSFNHSTRPNVSPNVPIYKDGYLYCTSGYGLGGVMLKLAADGTSVTEVWKNAFLDPKIGGAVELDGRIYGGGDRNRKIFCLDWKSGAEIYSLNQLAPCNIIANDGLLYIYSERGTASLVKPEADKFNIISTFTVPLGEGTHWAHLVINKGRLFLRHGTSLMVYDISAR
ncbi:MAG TPA: PQQ-binding-like beta-propeller repeat protein [Bacteroidales bacterium]|nr:PQQ-binding-like beta-propeller repeat protein [Bacteroidales bacterium]